MAIIDLPKTWQTWLPVENSPSPEVWDTTTKTLQKAESVLQLKEWPIISPEIESFINQISFFQDEFSKKQKNWKELAELLWRYSRWADKEYSKLKEWNQENIVWTKIIEAKDTISSIPLVSKINDLFKKISWWQALTESITPRDTTEELTQEGLKGLVEKIENYSLSSWDELNKMIEVKQKIEQYIKNLQDLLYTTINEDKKEEINKTITILQTNYNTVQTSIDALTGILNTLKNEWWQLIIMTWVSLLSKQVSNSSNVSINIVSWLREMTNTLMLLPWEQTNQVLEKFNVILQQPTISEKTINELVRQVEKQKKLVEENKKLLEVKLWNDWILKLTSLLENNQ